MGAYGNTVISGLFTWGQRIQYHLHIRLPLSDALSRRQSLIAYPNIIRSDWHVANGEPIKIPVTGMPTLLP
jgi:hypothetical protein